MLLICVVGVYSVTTKPLDIFIMAAFGVLGYILRKFDFDVAPLLLAVSQSEGSVIDTRVDPLSAAAQFAGGDPVRISRVGDAPMRVSTASSRAERSTSPAERAETPCGSPSGAGT